MALATIPTLLWSWSVSAGDFISHGGMPDPVLKKNIEQLVHRVITRKLATKEPRPVVTQILGKEDLGNSKARVWFCIQRRQGGRKVNACGSDVRLIRLDSGRWILKDDKHDTWIVARE
jgi:hypothetical protein